MEGTSRKATALADRAELSGVGTGPPVGDAQREYLASSTSTILRAQMKDLLEGSENGLKQKDSALMSLAKTDGFYIHSAIDGTKNPEMFI